jgi:mannose-1-phosphate guanylyltransferase
MRAVILAGGKGTRLRPLTDTRPKPLLPFAGDPFAAGLLRRLRAAGCTHATFLVGADGAPFAPLSQLGQTLGVVVDVVTEPEPLDTAGAARDLLRGAGDAPFVVCNGDILTDLDFAELIGAHTAAGATATLALTRVEDTSTFGVVETDADGAVLRFVEKPPPGTLAADTVNAGTYVLEPAAFSDSPASGPLSFERAVFPGLVEGGATVLGVASDAFWMDLGTPERYLAGQHAVLTEECRWPLGQDFRREGDSLVHRDATVAGDAELLASVVGPGAQVHTGASVERSALFEDVDIGQGATVHDAIVGEGAIIAAGANVTGPLAPHASA